MEWNRKQLDTDLCIIVIVPVLILGIYSVFNRSINEILSNTSINIVLRVLFSGGIFQFGLAGLGITIVTFLRKESFLGYGLTRKNLLPAIMLSALCCLPDFIYNYLTGNVHAWFSFSDVNTTAKVIVSGFPYNVLGMLITAICWGFFEGFNYVVIRDKLSERYPSKNRFSNSYQRDKDYCNAGSLRTTQNNSDPSQDICLERFLCLLLNKVLV